MKILFQAESTDIKALEMLKNLIEIVDIDDNELHFCTNILKSEIVFNEKIVVFVNERIFFQNPIKSFLDYDLILIAQDWKFAELAVKHHQNVHFIDELLLYLDKIPDTVEVLSGYYAINFSGMKEKFEKIKELNPNAKLVNQYQNKIINFKKGEKAFITFE
jgi:hypothetical protein